MAGRTQLSWWVALRAIVWSTLRGKFGDSYERYTREVGRWWPRRPRRGSGATLSGDRGV